MNGLGPLLRTILFVAALSGIGAGAVTAAIHLNSTAQLILKAEVYEEAEAAAAPAPATEQATPAAEAPHDHAVHAHDEEEWEPAAGFQRNGLTVLFTILTGFGFALLLVAASELKGGLTSWREGILWGFAGFAVFTLAPGLGLPPELPAMPAADLMERQIWWTATAAATAIGLALMIYGRSPLFAALGVLLIAAPQVIGAPQPPSYETPIPESLHHSFVVASILASFVFWVLIGGFAGWLRPRIGAQQALAPVAQAA
ncbi:CbtA family protein [Ancylobacter sp. 6x-1]|uniref:CbtA family protein n=1 Tax=Ancylobacter crimeensis TaxID=2579147 RepID=A0ABT0D9E1_9HYPH|nr:CbtA family protein [Ancylobacter crimeensis]MCK0196568.1 CbtA family protein [Ancylobacter crimeensis]